MYRINYFAKKKIDLSEGGSTEHIEKIKTYDERQWLQENERIKMLFKVPFN